jgi:hypothetical protein
MAMMNNKRREEQAKRRIGLLPLLLALLFPLFPGCDSALGGEEHNPGDGPASYTYGKDAADIARIVDSWSGVWYSRSGGRKLDGYRIGAWKDRRSLLPPEKAALFPGLDLDAPRFVNYSGAAYDAANDFPVGSGYPAGLEDAYFIFYDDTVYESEPGDGGNSGWGDTQYRYLGIVKAVNTFSDNTGAVIIHYLEGCFPNWDEDFIGPPPHCYFGIYYRIIDSDTIQMANAVVLDNLGSGKYYTETATLDAAIAKNTEANTAKFISWGVAVAQEREKLGQ